jgi:ATP-binding protein involved in chromosome partitioning
MGLFTKNAFTEADVLAALRTVIDPDLHRDIVTLGMVRDLKISGTEISFIYELTTPSCPLKDQMEAGARAAIARDLPAATNVAITMTAKVQEHRDQRKDAILPGVKNTIAIASGKGGVGKSTIAVNLAVSLAMDGARVGLLDADIYGPSAPMMFGLQGQRPELVEQNGARKMKPLVAHGVKVISIGFLIDPDDAMIWRGPMASGALKQLMSDTLWGELDYLIFDLPPGTGDIQLTLAQTIPLTGAVIVTTPQDISLADARKGYRMFERLKVPMLGIIENMSFYECPQCGHREHIFASGGGAAAAKDLGSNLLGEIPIDIKIRVGGDEGKPLVSEHPNDPRALAIRTIARNLAQQISIQNMSGSQKPVEILLGSEE